jgi:hypothetical protein
MELCGTSFFCRGEKAFLQGVLAKVRVLSVVFDGTFVVDCRQIVAR